MMAHFCRPAVASQVLVKRPWEDLRLGHPPGWDLEKTG